jgi:hypothetical protein
VAGELTLFHGNVPIESNSIKLSKDSVNRIDYPKRWTGHGTNDVDQSLPQAAISQGDSRWELYSSELV